MTPQRVSRRAFLGTSGALVIGFGLMAASRTQTTSAQTTTAQPTPAAPATAVATEVSEQQPVPSPVAVPSAPPQGQIDPNQVDSWLAVGQDGKVTIFSGRVELGTGTRTALGADRRR